MSSNTRLVASLILLLLLFSSSGGFEKLAPSIGPKLVTIVYESADMPMPAQALLARPKLREAGHQVRIIDQDVKTGTGGVPKEVAVSIAAARTHGLPALVVASLDGSKVLQVVELPKTPEAICEAVK